MYHYFRKPPHGRPWVSGLSSHIALYVATYPASEKKNRTQVNCTSFWGEQLWTCTFFFEVGQKKWEQHVFGLFLGGDVFETWYFLGSWCSIFQEFNLSIFQYFNQQKWTVCFSSQSIKSQSTLQCPSCATKSQNPTKQLIASEMIPALINMYGSNMIISFFLRIFIVNDR